MPVRCFSCGKPVAEHSDEYAQKISKGEDPAKAMNELGVDRYCCRRMMLSHEELIDDIMPYKRF